MPQPLGPSSVVKVPPGMSSETSSTAATSPNRFVTPSSRTPADGAVSMGRCAVNCRALLDHGVYPPAKRRIDARRPLMNQTMREDDHRHADQRDGEGGRAAPVEVIDELEDRDRRDGRPRREEEDDDGERRDGADERGDERGERRAPQHREEDVAEAAQTARAQPGRRLVNRAVNLLQARRRPPDSRPGCSRRSSRA